MRLFFCPPPFQTSQCWEQIVGVMLLCSMLEINDVVLYCIVLYCIVLYCIVRCCTVLLKSVILKKRTGFFKEEDERRTSGARRGNAEARGRTPYRLFRCHKRDGPTGRRGTEIEDTIRTFIFYRKKWRPYYVGCV